MRKHNPWLVMISQELRGPITEMAKNGAWLASAGSIDELGELLNALEQDITGVRRMLEKAYRKEQETAQ